MARILIVYGSTHGQTIKISEVLAQDLRSLGATADVFDAAAEPRPDGYDAVIVAASVHAGSYQRPVVRWVRRHAPALAGKPTAFLSVCLGILQKDPNVRRELDAIVERFTSATGWHPAMKKHVPGALPYTRYNWFVRLTMKRIAGKAGGDTDTSRDFEYTDWNDVRAFAAQFNQRVLEAAAKLPAAAPA